MKNLLRRLVLPVAIGGCAQPLPSLAKASVCAERAEGARQVDVRVRTRAGGPMVEVDGRAVPPRMFWGKNGCRPCRLDGAGWSSFTFTFTPQTDIARGTFHLRFPRADSGEVSLRNFRLSENGNPAEDGFAGAFADEASLGRAWRVWPEGHVRAHVVSGGVCTVALRPARQPGRVPDYHFHSVPRRFAKGVRHALSFDARGSGDCRWMRVACHAVGPGGRHVLVPFEGDSLSATAAKARAAGVNFVSYGLPGGWTEGGPDFSAADEVADALVAVNPDVLLVPRVNVNAPAWWCRKNPDHRMAFAKEQDARVGRGDGLRPDMAAVSSRLYREDAKAYLAAFCRHMMARYPRNFAGVHPAGQNTSEWFYYRSGVRMNGWDPQTREAFRAYLGDPRAEVPSCPARCAGSDALLLDPEGQADCIAFNRFQQDEMADFLSELAHVCRRETLGKKLVVLFYGYTWEFAGHGQGPANTGHYGVERLLSKAAGAIDVLCGPISYFDRFAFGSAPSMSASETVMRQGVLWLNEDDTRTHLVLSSRARTQEGDRVDARGARNLLLRNTAQEAVRGFGSWWMDLEGEGWHDAKELWDVQRALMPVERLMLTRKRPFEPDVALVLDEASMVQVATRAVSVMEPMAVLARGAANRIGAPHGQYLLFDAVREPLKARLQVFQGAWALSDEKVDSLVRQRKERPALRVWCYAPACRDETGGGDDLARMRRLCGFSFLRRPGVAKGDGVFAVETGPGDEVLERYPDGAASLVVRRNGWGGADAFWGDPKTVTAKNMRALADRAGVRCRIPAEDVGRVTLWETGGLGETGSRHVLSLQAARAGPVRVLTGGGVVQDALTGAVVGRGESVTLDMEPGGVRVLTWRQDGGEARPDTWLSDECEKGTRRDEEDGNSR